MNSAVARLALFWVAIGLCCAQERIAVPILSVCEALRSLDVYRGRSVVVVGHSGFTFEGTFMDEPCESDKQILIQRRRWVSMIEIGTTQPSKFVEVPEAELPVAPVLLWRKLSEVSGYVPPSGQAVPSAALNDDSIWGNWDAVYGRIESPVRLKQKRRGSGYSGNGYGSNGTVPAIIRATRVKTLIRGRGLEVKHAAVPNLP